MAEGKHNSSRGSRSTSSSYSISEEIFGRKDGGTSARTTTSSSSPSYFSSVFPPTSSVMGNDSAHSDLYRTLNKNKTDGQIGNNAQSMPAGIKSQGSPTRRQPTYNNDAKPVYPNESMESAYFGSSVHYGGRDFYTSSSSSQASETSKNYKIDNGEDYDNTNAANRGEWWQGSLYY